MTKKETLNVLHFIHEESLMCAFSKCVVMANKICVH